MTITPAEQVGQAALSGFAQYENEIAELKRQLKEWRDQAHQLLSNYEHSEKQLAESQAREARLRAALIRHQELTRPLDSTVAALALPHDDTALKEYRDAVIDECANVCDTEWNGDADTYEYANACNECAEAVREMKSVVKSTAKGDLNVI